MNGYDLEIIVDVLNDQLWIGVALRDYSPDVKSKHAVQSKRNRSSLGETTLSSAISYCLCQYADIAPGDIVLDPLGGVGTICIEGSQVFDKAFFLSGDISKKYVESARTNVQDFASGGNAAAIVWDSTDLPIADGSVGNVSLLWNLILPASCSFW